MNRGSDGAISPVLGFLAAMGAYAIAMAVFMGYASAPPTESSTVDSDLQSRAATGIEVIISDGSTWPADHDELARFGMATSDANFLDYDKIKDLRRAQATSVDNGRVDYQEARSALGLTDHQFHLRTYPALLSTDDLSWEQMRGFRVAYVADYGAPESLATLVETVVTTGDVKEWQLNITNTGADPMIFVTAFSWEVDGEQVTSTRQTKLLADGQADTVAVSIHPLQEWDQATMELTMVTSDNYDNCTGCDDKTPPAEATVESGTYRYHLLAEASNSYYLQGATVELLVDHFDKDGDKLNNKDARIRVYRPAFAGAWTQEAAAMHEETTDDLPNQNNQRWEVDCACADREGLWKVIATPKTDLARETTFYYWVSATDLFTAGVSISPTGANERQYIDELVEDFDPALYEDGGDVFADDHQEMDSVEDAIDNNPPACTDAPEYDMLVVGSNTAHNALVMIKNEVADFVECGGVLITFGSSRSGTEWLQEVYHVALRDGAGGGIGQPDLTHPLLTVPEKLSWNQYLDSGYVWDIKDGEDIFSHALDGADASELILGVSEQGALDGTVVLTSWTPGALTDPQDDVEAKKLLHNLLSQGYQMLFLDYGPTIPSGVPVGSSSRLAAVEYTEIAQGPFVELRVLFYVWRG
ncbi:MAG TPA: hypothetical protein VI997_02505 [Candidatus Thermoplasmatota archaeon]|nr:hypothetical protein [Candidatus Thermoplasmatota archaeon]